MAKMESMLLFSDEEEQPCGFGKEKEEFVGDGVTAGTTTLNKQEEAVVGSSSGSVADSSRR